MTTPLRSIDHAQLTPQQVAILDFESQWWRQPGVKEQGIREKFDMSAPRYYQILAMLIDTPAALAHDPLLVKRLRRLRDARARRRSAKMLGVDLDV